MEKLKADASGILDCVRQLKGLRNHCDNVGEAITKKRSLELDLKESKLQKLSSDLDERVKEFEAEKAKAGDLKKLVGDCTEELRSKRNELTAKLDTSIKIHREIELKSKHLGKVMVELRKARERQREVEEETGRKTKDLGLILVKIEESDKQLKEMSMEVELKKKELQILSLDLEKKGKLFEDELEEKGKELDLVKSQVKSCERKQIQVKKLVDDSSVRKDQVDSSKKVQGEAELKKKKKRVGQTKTVLVKHNGVEEENLGKLSASF